MNGSLAENVRRGHLAGWSFTPLAGKKPVLKGWQSAPRGNLAQALEWAGKDNVGLRTGRISGVVVIDADPGADLSALNLPDTVVASRFNGSTRSGSDAAGQIEQLSGRSVVTISGRACPRKQELKDPSWRPLR